MPDLLVLGPQFRAPVLREALQRAGFAGPMVAITAGWQEREGELGALEEHLGTHVRDLRLYERAEAAFTLDTELQGAYRERQNELRRMQDLYRLRLDHAKAAARELLALPAHASDAVRRAQLSAIAALRRLDSEHVASIRRVHEQFEARWHPAARPSIASQLAELRHLLEDQKVVLIAGGHVAVLVNRLRLFGMERLLRGHKVAAWSAGAMAAASRIVLFHDHPPQGAGNAEVFEAGLGILPGAIFLPHARDRLALGDPARVSLLARRFAPSPCYTLDEGSWLAWSHGRLAKAHASWRLARSGEAVAVSAAA
jgi:hypothetical protein